MRVMIFSAIAIVNIITPAQADNMALGMAGGVARPATNAPMGGFNACNNGIRYGGYGGYGAYPTYGNPYNTMYGGYGYNPYQGRYIYGGNSIPVYGMPQFIGNGMYGINYGGAVNRYWRSPSGFYYPWAGGYNYTSYPIFVMPPSNGAPSQTIPPVSTVVKDLDSYLEKAKANGKISAGDYQSLRQRASDLLSKQNSIKYEEGGSIDPENEAQIRSDLDELSAEVAHRVKP